MLDTTGAGNILYKMEIFFFILLLCSLAIAEEDETWKTISILEYERRFPAQVSLQEGKDLVIRSHFCGGSLITLQHVVTTATCLMSQVTDASGEIIKKIGTYRDISKMIVVAKTNYLTTDGEVRRVATMTVHPRFKEKKYYFLHNIAMVKTNKPFNKEPGLDRVIPRRTAVRFDEICYLLQWKVKPENTYTDINKLKVYAPNDRTYNGPQRAKYVASIINLKSPFNCKKTFCQNDINDEFNIRILCGELGSSGDVTDGSTVMCRRGLTGILSTYPGDLGVSDTTTTFVNVYHYLPWIKKVIHPEFRSDYETNYRMNFHYYLRLFFEFINLDA